LVVGFLALATAGLTTQEVLTVRGVSLAVEPMDWYVIVPFCLASLISGVVQGLGTKWGC
jgi:hypothetical protein